MKTATARVLDGWAMGLSGLCLVHCLALSLAVALAPAMGALARAEWVHVLLVAFAAPLAAVALLRQVDGRSPPVAMIGLGGLGVICLTVGAFGPESLDTPITVIGSTCLVAAHIWNWRRRSQGHVHAYTVDA
jgi:hypothetical protein